MPGYKVSKDGKTVTVGSKTYSIRAFKNQFDYRGDLAKPGGGGSAVQSPVARKIVTPKVSDSPEFEKKSIHVAIQEPFRIIPFTLRHSLLPLEQPHCILLDRGLILTALQFSKFQRKDSS